MHGFSPLGYLQAMSRSQSRGRSVLLLAAFLAGPAAAGAAADLPGSPWPKPLGGPDRETAQGLAADEQGNLYTAGRFDGAATFDAVRLASAGQTDVFVARSTPPPRRLGGGGRRRGADEFARSRGPAATST